MVRKVVSIVSLARSGSTMLDVLLGSHPRLVGIGEAYNFVDNWRGILDRPEIEDCSCGRPIPECPFWGPTWRLVRDGRDRPLVERYAMVLERCAEFFGPDRIPVDSSKRVEQVELCHRSPEIEQKVLFLIKDVRPWVVSNLENLKRQDAFYLSDMVQTYGWRLKQYLNRVPLKICWAWYRANKRIRDYLRREGIDHLQLGYDELALYPDHMLDLIFRHLEVDQGGPLSMTATDSHSIIGNPMRFQPEKRAGVIYDNRWFKRREWIWSSLLLTPVMAFNTRQVYRNTSRRFWG